MSAVATGRVRRAAADRVRNLTARRRATPVPESVQVELPAGVTTRYLSDRHGVIVLWAETEPRQVIRAAVDRFGGESVRRHVRALEDLRADPRCSGLRTVVPELIRVDPDGSWVIESAFSGESGSVLARRGLGARTTDAALHSLARLYEPTGAPRLIDERDVDAWVDTPIRALRAVIRSPRLARRLDTLAAYLRLEVLGLECTIARVHGDASPGNFMFTVDLPTADVTLDGSTADFTVDGPTVTGIVDWEASGWGIPDVDIAHYLLTARCELAGGELGSHVVDVIDHGWSAEERRLLATYGHDDGLPHGTIVLLAWLHHVSNNLRKSGRYAGHLWWIRANVIRVLAGVDVGGPPLDRGGGMLEPQEASLTPAGAPSLREKAAADGPLELLDLTLDTRSVRALMCREAEAEHWFDAFLLAAGLDQIVEDHLCNADSILARAASLFGGSPRAVVHALGSAAGIADRTGDLLRTLRRSDRRLGAHRDEVMRLTIDLARAGNVPGGLDRKTASELQQRVRRSAAIATGTAALERQIIRLPACFRSFDQAPGDVETLVEEFSERFVDRARPVLVVGVRTSGSYLAPLAAAHFARLGYGSISVLTTRPGEPLDRRALRCVERVRDAGGVAVVLDDPPVAGHALARVVAAMRTAGMPASSVVLMVSVDEPSGLLPARLASVPAVTLPPQRWKIIENLSTERTRRALSRLLPSNRRLEELVRIDGALSRDRDSREHQRALFDGRIVDTDTHASADVRIVAEGVGLGYLGRHAVAVADRIAGWVPEVVGFDDGVLYQLLPDGEAGAVPPEVVADYAAARALRLRVARDGSASITGRQTVFEIAAELVGGALGRADLLARLGLVQPIVRRLLSIDAPSIVDGNVSRELWVRAGTPSESAEWRKVDFASRSFSHRELLCYDAVYDVASPLDGDPAADRVLTSRARARWEEVVGRRVEAERWLLYRLVHGWRRRREGASELWFRRQVACALQDYVGEVFFGDLACGTGPWCALDVDGVLETGVMGATAPGFAGAHALRALIAHDHRVVVATGRSALEILDRCAAWPLAGGVAEYGTALVGPGEGIADLRTEAQIAVVERVREIVAGRPGVHLDPSYRHAVRAFRTDDRGRRRGLADEDLAALAQGLERPDAIQLVEGDDQTDIVPSGCTKATGIAALLDRLDPGAARLARPLALAVGDGIADVPMLDLASLAAMPRHRRVDTDTRVLITRRSYQAGLSEAVARLLGHHPGACEICRIEHSERELALFGLLSVREGGAAGIPRRVVGAAIAGRRLVRGRRITDRPR